MDLPFAKLIDIPPVWLAAFAAVVWVQGAVLPFGPAPGDPGAWLGGILVALGLALVGLAAIAFQRHRTSIIPHMAPKAMITSGVFAWSRNPIYLADVLILAGLSLRWHGYLGFAMLPVFMILITRRFIVAEETRLQAGFGAEFDAYAQKVRRWI